MSIKDDLSRKTLSVSVVAALVGLGTAASQLYDDNFGSHAVVIASSPAGATIRINAKDYGITPSTLSLKRGTYTIEAQRDGFEPAQHAVFV